MTGKIIAEKFYIMEQLGEGGMGQVYKARHLALDKLVCVKILRQSLITNATLVSRFEREAKAASRLRHPNSIQVLDFGTFEKGGFYIVMEYVNGRDLAATLAEEWPLTEMRVCHIASQVLGALAAAHAAQVIHRDLKPENVMLEKLADDPDYVKVLDFGIAKLLVPDEPGLTRGDLVCGTPQYMSPEQATGAPIDGRSDLYAVGVILYRMVTGFLPFEGRNPMDFLTKHATEKPMPPRLRRPDAQISPELERLILRSLEKDPALRPQTAEDFRRELMEIEAARRVESSGTMVMSGRAKQAGIAQAVTQFPAAPTQAGERIIEPPEDDGEPVPGPISQPTVSSQTRVSLATAHDMSAAVASYRENYRARRARLFAVVGLLLAAAGVGLWLYWPQMPDEWKEKPREYYGQLSSAINHFLRRNQLGKGHGHSKSKGGEDDAQGGGEGEDTTSVVQGASAVHQGTSAGCPDGEILIPNGKSSFCIDQYEYPNEAGTMPVVWVPWPSAQELCRRKGRRLCTATEWEVACRGPSSHDFSSVSGRGEPDLCNTADYPGHKGALMASGSLRTCTNGFNVVDMSGNAGEWTSTPVSGSPDSRIVKGGSAREGLEAARCAAEGRELVTGRGEALGFRCCSKARN
jgi:serine/threonine protein kinase